jgi:hypothetical protein
MKRIVIFSKPERNYEALIACLNIVFPECEVETIPVYREHPSEGFPEQDGLPEPLAFPEELAQIA